jgi:alcohol dehydrogenase
MYGVPHGLANAITLPYVLDFLKDDPRVRDRLAELAIVIGVGSPGEPGQVLAQRFVDRVRDLNRAIGIPDKMAALKPADVPAIARAAMIEASRDYPVPKVMTLAEGKADPCGGRSAAAPAATGRRRARPRAGRDASAGRRQVVASA